MIRNFIFLSALSLIGFNSVAQTPVVITSTETASGSVELVASETAGNSNAVGGPNSSTSPVESGNYGSGNDGSININVAGEYIDFLVTGGTVTPNDGAPSNPSFIENDTIQITGITISNRNDLSAPSTLNIEVDYDNSGTFVSVGSIDIGPTGTSFADAIATLTVNPIKISEGDNATIRVISAGSSNRRLDGMTLTLDNTVITDADIALKPVVSNGLLSIIGLESGAQVTIFHSSGKEILSQDYSESINIASLNSGIYLLRIIDSNGLPLSKAYKFMK